MLTASGRYNFSHLSTEPPGSALSQRHHIYGRQEIAYLGLNIQRMGDQSIKEVCKITNQHGCPSVLVSYKSNKFASCKALTG